MTRKDRKGPFTSSPAVVDWLFVERKGRKKALVDRDLVSGDELVGFVGHSDNGLKFLEHFGSHAFGESGSRVGGDAVLTVVCDADGDVEKFFGKGIEGARSHDLLEAFPSAFEKSGIVGDGLPEIVDVVGFARGHDVVIDGFDGGAGVGVFDEAKGGHGVPP